MIRAAYKDYSHISTRLIGAPDDGTLGLSATSQQLFDYRDTTRRGFSIYRIALDQLRRVLRERASASSSSLEGDASLQLTPKGEVFYEEALTRYHKQRQ